MSLRQEIARLLSNLIPRETRVILRGSQQPPATAHAMDVDVLHGYLRAAESGETWQLFGLYRDILAGHAHTQGEFSKRKLAVLGETMSLTSHDPKDAAAVARDSEVQKHLLERPDWLRFLSHCLDSSLYPVAVSARAYRESFRPGWRYEISEIAIVPHHFLGWPQGQLRIRQTDDSGNFTGQFLEPESRTHIVHRGNLLTSLPDWWGGPMRALLFWWLSPRWTGTGGRGFWTASARRF